MILPGRSFLLSGLRLLVLAAAATGQTPPGRPAAGPTLAGCPVFPPDHIWNTPIQSLPTDPRSADYVASIGLLAPLHPDFGPPGTRLPGIPFNVVPPGQPKVPVQFRSEESDPGPYPIPPNAIVEDGKDRHVLVLDQGDCKLYEMFYALRVGDGWNATGGSVFDLRDYALRKLWWSSADAAGFAILPGLIRYDEVAAGEIRHAIRFTAPKTRGSFVWPARHRASVATSEALPPMGQRFRLRSSFDISGFAPEVRVILKALQTYGMFLADHGGPWFLSGAPDPRWDLARIRQLRRLAGADFEAVNHSSLQISPDSAKARQPGK